MRTDKQLGEYSKLAQRQADANTRAYYARRELEAAEVEYQEASAALGKFLEETRG